MDNKHKQILRLNRLKLEDDLELEDIWSHLISYGVFEPSDQDEMIRPNRKPIGTLLDKLEQRGQNAFKLFVKAVSESSKSHLVEWLKEKEPNENEEPQKKNDGLLGDKTDSELAVQKEFEDDGNFNVGDGLKSCQGDGTEQIRRLQQIMEQFQEENAVLKTNVAMLNAKMTIHDYRFAEMNREIESCRAEQRATDYGMTSCLLERNRILNEQNQELHIVQRQMLYHNRQLWIENERLAIELQKRKRGCNHDAGCCQKKRKYNGI